jgi:hypothetical protein
MTKPSRSGNQSHKVGATLMSPAVPWSGPQESNMNGHKQA